MNKKIKTSAKPNSPDGPGTALLCHCTPDDVVYCAMPLYHANAQVLALAPPLLSYNFV